MSCHTCTSSRIKQKLGRCRRCVIQLLLFVPASWGAWWYFYRTTPTTVESLTLLCAAGIFSLLLCLHGLSALKIHYSHSSKHKKPGN
ncbi:DUF3624 domain-containing protein [Photobacterium minamisatsumaniensis]|uniref:DUF3624 domain-containing protein n=1 Tax=Photobacterium minamisatsumaniensis TaxID=2910233 RepID=UPI003D0E6948